MYQSMVNILLTLILLLLNSGCDEKLPIQIEQGDEASDGATEEIAPVLPPPETLPIPPIDVLPPVVYVPPPPKAVLVPVNPRAGGGAGRHKPRLPCEEGTTDCNDKNPCTIDTCIDDTCVHTLDTSKDQFGSCETDGNSCTIGKCIQTGEEIVCLEQRREFIVGELGCQDNNQCTTDSCIISPLSTADKIDAEGNVIPDNEHQCVQEVVTGLLCNLNHECLVGFCQQSGTGMTPQDPFLVTCVIDETAIPVCPPTNNPCTESVCDVQEGCIIQNLPANTPCDDFDPCTMNEVCNQGSCSGGMAVVCPSDNNPCTDDLCKTGTGCIYPPTILDPLPSCTDNNACSINDVCSNGACVGELEDCTANLDPVCQIGFCDLIAGCQIINLTGPYGADCETPYPGICATGAFMCLDGTLTTMCEPLIRPGDKLETCEDQLNLDEDCDGDTTDFFCENLTFVFSAHYPADDGPSAVAFGDLDGDTDLDMAVANLEGSVSVLLNNGNGTFAGAITYVTDGGSNSIALGDLDGDNDLDIVTTNSALAGNNVSVLLNDGFGAFAAPTNYVAGSFPVSVALGDVDGDNNLDMVVANSGSDNVSVFLNDGMANFSGPTNYAAGDIPESVALGFINGDNDLDLVVANRADSTVSVLLNNGLGAFLPKVDYPTDQGPVSVAVGDLDGDSDIDVVTASDTADNASVLLNDGSGALMAAVNYGAGDGSRSVALGDVDGDDDLDMVIANIFGDNVSVLLNNGSGIFSLLNNFAVGNGPRSVALGDLNNDSYLDLATANFIGGVNATVLFGMCICP